MKADLGRFVLFATFCKNGLENRGGPSAPASSHEPTRKVEAAAEKEYPRPIMKSSRFVLFTLSLIGTLAFSPRPAWADAPADPSQKEPTESQRVYYFEHKLLPSWVHKSEGAFYSDLGKGETKQMFEAATEIIGKDFADGMKVRKIGKPDGFLITFPKPKEAPQCFFAAVLKDGSEYHYVTLELGEDLMGDGSKTFLCEWASDGSHLDFGSRKFDDEAHFLSELEDRSKKSPDQAPPAGQTPATPPAPKDSHQPAGSSPGK